MDGSHNYQGSKDGKIIAALAAYYYPFGALIA
jgi:hypothetical protein